MLRKTIRNKNNEENQRAKDQEIIIDQEFSDGLVAEPVAKNDINPLTEDLERSVDEASDEDLYILNEPTRNPQLPEGDHPGTVGKIKAEKMATGKYGPWTQITVTFRIKHPETDETVEVRSVANKSMSASSRLFPIVKGILGRAPEAGFNLKDLEGQRVMVSIEHGTDPKGNVWDNPVFVRPLRK